MNDGLMVACLGFESSTGVGLGATVATGALGASEAGGGRRAPVAPLKRLRPPPCCSSSHASSALAGFGS